MELIRLEDPGLQEFKEAWQIYVDSFPSDERRALELQKEAIKNKKYNFSAAINDGVLVAIIAYWNIGGFLFLEHFAVIQDMRGKGIGTELLKRHILANKQKVVLEVERPETEIAIKRIGFYERIGFRLNDFKYVQPPYGKDKNPVPMLLMTYPDKVFESGFLLIRGRLHTVVYGLEKPIL
jgi:GNAT superfamily N-acetyltransferase